MKIINLNEINIAKTPHDGEIRKLLSFKYATIVHIKLKQGESLKMHITPVDALFYVLEGEGLVEIGEEKQTISKDQLIFSPAKIKHRVCNKKDKDLRFLVIKVPTPVEETKIL